jgi:flagellar biosynthetic protein FliQ
MSATEVAALGRELLWVSLLLAGPALAASLVVGFLVSVLQALTTLQEQTLNFVPRLLAVAAVLAWTMPWALQIAGGYTTRLIAHMVDVTAR